MKKNLRFVGLDVHKDTISIAVAESGREPARLLETIPADAWLLLKVLDRLGPKSRLRVCYEAGPTGYGLARQLQIRIAGQSQLNCGYNNVGIDTRTITHGVNTM